MFCHSVRCASDIERKLVRRGALGAGAGPLGTATLAARVAGRGAALPSEGAGHEAVDVEHAAAQARGGGVRLRRAFLRVLCSEVITAFVPASTSALISTSPCSTASTSSTRPTGNRASTSCRRRPRSSSSRSWAPRPTGGGVALEARGLLAACFATSLRNCDSLGDRAGLPSLRLVGEPPARPPSRRGVALHHQGFSLHVGDRIDSSVTWTARPSPEAASGCAPTAPWPTPCRRRYPEGLLRNPLPPAPPLGLQGLHHRSMRRAEGRGSRLPGPAGR